MTSTRSTREAGIALVVVSLGALLAMSHHPTVASDTLADALREIEHERGLNSAVHGSMILVVALYHWAFGVFSIWLDDRRRFALLAHTSFGFATALMTGAALVSGFIVPEFAARVAASAAPGDAQALFTLLYVSNQAAAELGSVAYGLAMVIWSLTLLRHSARLDKAVGAFGLVGGAVIAALVGTGHWTLSVSGMTGVVVLLGAWACGVGAVLIRAR